jgi:AraC-like DNA-binding protein
MSTKASSRVLNSFLAETSVLEIVNILDLLADTLFWIKDKESRVMHANSAFVVHMGRKSLHQIIGKTDLEFAPAHLAKQFLNDDKKVLSGESITDRIELNVNELENLSWYVTSKRPLFNSLGEIIGSYGMTHSLEKSNKLLSMVEPIKLPVEYIREHYAKDIRIDELAKISFLSVSALERRFTKYLGKTPKQFINQVRLERARQLLLETDRSVSEICDECGFSDKSYFSKQFKRLFMIQPSKLRKPMQENEY